MLKSLLFPTRDPRQLHRLRRWMMASGASMLVVVLFLAAYLLDLLDLEAFATAALLVVGFFVLFYAVFRSGPNLRFRRVVAERLCALARRADFRRSEAWVADCRLDRGNGLPQAGDLADNAQARGSGLVSGQGGRPLRAGPRPLGTQ